MSSIGGLGKIEDSPYEFPSESLYGPLHRLSKVELNGAY